MNDVIPPQLLLYIVCTDFFGDIIYMIGGFLTLNAIKTEITPIYGICVFQGLANTFEEFSLLLWVTSIAFNYYYTFNTGQLDAIIKFKKIFVITCFGIPFLLTLALMILQFVKGDVITDVQIWCWINPKYPEYRLIFFYFWLFVCIIVNIVMYIKIFRSFNGNVPSKISNVIKIQFTLYLISFFVAWTAAVINRIYEWSNQNSQSVTLTIIQAFCEPSQGWLLLVTYSFITNKYAKVDPSIAIPLTHGYNETKLEE